MPLNAYIRKLFVVSSLLWLPGLGFGQEREAVIRQADSLLREVEAASSDTLRIRLLQRVAQTTAGVENVRNEAAHLRILELCADHLDNTAPDADSLFYREAEARAQLKVGIHYFLAANYLKAQPYLLEALQSYEGLENPQQMAMSCIVLGAMHKNQEDYAGAITYMEQALALSEAVNDTVRMALTYTNLGTVYIDLDSLALAREDFAKSLDFYETLDDKRGMGVALLNLGSVAKSEKDLDKARDYFERSLEIRQEINDKQGLIFSHARLGTVLLEQKQYVAARQNAEASLRLAQEKEFIRGIRDANELLSLIYAQTGDHRKAYEYHLKFITAKDSMISQDNVRALTQAAVQHKYELELAEDSVQYAEQQKNLQTELALQEAEGRQQRFTSRLLAGGVLLALLLGGFVYQRYQQARKQQRIIESQKEEVQAVAGQLAQSNEEKELLLKEIHHRVKNNLQVISSVLDLQTKNLEDDLALSAIADGQGRVRAMALIHEKLYQNEDIARLNFTDYVRQLMTQIAGIYSIGAEVERQVESEVTELDIDTAIPLGLILNELLTNAFKYGIQGHPNGKVGVFIRIQEEGIYELEVRDNGPGMPEDFQLSKAKSLGLRLVRRLSQQLYGSVTHRNEGGAVFSVTFQDTWKRKEVE